MHYLPLQVKVGQTFDNIEAITSTFINEVEKTELITLYKRDAKKIATISKICPKKCVKAKTDLIYYRLEYACIKGGKKKAPVKESELQSRFL